MSRTSLPRHSLQRPPQRRQTHAKRRRRTAKTYRLALRIDQPAFSELLSHQRRVQRRRSAPARRIVKQSFNPQPVEARQPQSHCRPRYADLSRYVLLTHAVYPQQDDVAPSRHPLGSGRGLQPTLKPLTICGGRRSHEHPVRSQLTDTAGKLDPRRRGSGASVGPTESAREFDLLAAQELPGKAESVPVHQCGLFMGVHSASHALTSTVFA